MRLTFAFTLSTRSPDDLPAIVKTSLLLPDSIRRLPDIQTQVIKLGELVAQHALTGLQITCRKLGLSNHGIRQPDETVVTGTLPTASTILKLERSAFFRPEKRILQIPVLSLPPIPFATKPPTWDLRNPLLDTLLIQEFRAQTSAQQDYLDRIHAIANQCLILLNTEAPRENVRQWVFSGFHPYWEERERAEPKDHERPKPIHALKPVAASTTSTFVGPAHSTRRFGANPGTFKGIWMRSQGEIRCAAELEKRGIRWRYEYERLGPQQYLVDFYLPNYGVWIEVKYNELDARDEFQLPEVAAYLARERGHRLYLFSNRGCFRITADGFAPVDRKTFWDEIVSA